MAFNEGRDAITQAYLAQQGLLPPEGQFHPSATLA
jgi:hypothetical protein